MPKMKTRSTAKKRFKKTKSGMIKRPKAFRRKKFTNKTAKRKRHLRKAGYVSKANVRAIKKLIATR